MRCLPTPLLGKRGKRRHSLLAPTASRRGTSPSTPHVGLYIGRKGRVREVVCVGRLADLPSSLEQATLQVPQGWLELGFAFDIGDEGERFDVSLGADMVGQRGVGLGVAHALRKKNPEDCDKDAGTHGSGVAPLDWRGHGASPMLAANMRGSAFVALVAGFVIAGCQSEIGDGCGSSSDCALNASRICDTTQPGGYCTIQGCDPDTCPGNSLCVEWRFVPGRLSTRFCMSQCRVAGDCRGEYSCFSGLQNAETVEQACIELELPDPETGEPRPFARVIDILPGKADGKFCAALEQPAPFTCPEG